MVVHVRTVTATPPASNPKHRANHKRKLATIFGQPWTNGIHGEIYCACEEQKYNRLRQLLWKRDGVTQTKRLIPLLLSPVNLIY